MTSQDPDQSEGLSLREGSTDADAVRRYYDTWADSYDGTLEDWDYRAPNDCADLVMPHLHAGSRILDVGCGTGLMGAVLRNRDPHAVLDGIDISAASLERARARGVYADLTCHDLQKPPLPAEGDAYAAAVCVGVLTYLDDPAALLRDLCRCVAPGGLLAFTQRSDLWEPRDFPGILDALETAGLCRPLHIGEPRPYLPGNADFGDEILVVHTLCAVA